MGVPTSDSSEEGESPSSRRMKPDDQRPPDCVREDPAILCSAHHYPSPLLPFPDLAGFAGPRRVRPRHTPSLCPPPRRRFYPSSPQSRRRLQVGFRRVPSPCSSRSPGRVGWYTLPLRFSRPRPAPSAPSVLMHRLALAALLLALALPAARTALARPTLAAPASAASPGVARPPCSHVSRRAPPAQQASGQVAARLDAPALPRVNTLIVPTPPLPQPLTQLPPSTTAASPLHKASRRRRKSPRHSLPAPSAFRRSPPATARFWLSPRSRRLPPRPPALRQPARHPVHRAGPAQITNGAAGQRIVLSDSTPPHNSSRSARLSPALPHCIHPHANRSSDPPGAQLQIDSQLSELDLPEPEHSSLLRTVAHPNFCSTSTLPLSRRRPSPYPALARAISALLLAPHSAALIEAGQSLIRQADATPRPGAAPHPAPTLAVNRPAARPRPAARQPQPWPIRTAAQRTPPPHATVRYGTVTPSTSTPRMLWSGSSVPASNLPSRPAVRRRLPPFCRRRCSSRSPPPSTASTCAARICSPCCAPTRQWAHRISTPSPSPPSPSTSANSTARYFESAIVPIMNCHSAA